MNFLAHAALAGPEMADRLGAMLGDFVKGLLPAGLPPSVAAGVELHRRIDSFADAHPAFRQSRARVCPERRRVAGIMIDLFYDHFLALHWKSYFDQPLESFTAETYALMAAHPELLPPRLAQLLPHMQAGDWLASYRVLESVASALDRIGQHRLAAPNALPGSAAELEARYRDFEQDFLSFFPDAQAYSEAFRRGRTFRDWRNPAFNAIP
jgi:acyl carrier protein phosphodiesterase